MDRSTRRRGTSGKHTRRGRTWSAASKRRRLLVERRRTKRSRGATTQIAGCILIRLVNLKILHIISKGIRVAVRGEIPRSRSSRSCHQFSKSKSVPVSRNPGTLQREVTAFLPKNRSEFSAIQRLSLPKGRRGLDFRISLNSGDW